MLLLSAHIVFGLQLDCFKIFWKALIIVIPLLSFKGIAHEYLLQMSIKQNLNPLLNWLINCISARSAPQILSLQGKCTFLFLNFLILGLCNFSVNSLFGIFSFLIRLPEVFYRKICRPLKQDLFHIHHISDF